MYDVILSFITAFTLTYFAIPSIINIADKKNLVDEPGDRRAHKIRTPSLGGIGIFAGIIFSIVLWTPFNVFGDLQYILCAFIIIFLVGAKDDIIPMLAWKKLVAQLLAASILVYRSNVKITSMYGIFGIGELPEWLAIAFSIFIILVIINAFNLIDGINGLSGGVGILMTLIFGSWFYLTGFVSLAVVSFSLCGSILAFLHYNVTPAKIFMGDTGSLLLGLIAAILALKFIELQDEVPIDSYRFVAAPAVAIGIIILPLFDTLRVFTMRVLKGKSPFSPDRTHIHHYLIDLGLSHMKATSILLSINVLFVLVVFKFDYLGSLRLLGIIMGMAILGIVLLEYLRKRHRANNQQIMQSQ